MPEQSIAFDRVADRYDATRGGMERGRALAAGLAERLDLGLVLEIGVGTGAVALGLVEHGFDVVGVDLSQPMLDRAVERLGARVARADASAVPVRDGSVGGVAVVWVLALVADPAALVAEAARALRPGGRAAIVANRSDNAEDEMDALMARIETLRSDQDSAEHVAGYASGAGLDVEDVTVVAGTALTQSPNGLASTLEQRLFSSLWDLDDERWNTVVVPVIEELRALPDPDRRRDKIGRHRLIVLRKP